ncbi:heparan-alpha-glucosaminide N-acetyltransferase domain-containing protein [Microbacterium oxydans]|uniref:heparan-alpha-glucosaminide N-acetyltransferase domain-containing protein n=1 Tax=Microbacterium oxydans TaxID=82380 RepID=UPI00366E8D71
MPQDTNTHMIARPHRTARREQPTPPPESDAARHRGELGRMVGIDFARFLAIIGMFCAHLLPPAGLPGHVEWVSTIVDGNASTLFAVVGGISVVLATRSYLERGHVAAARWAMAVRGVLVILIGATLALAPGSIVVVLVYFGVAMLCSIPFLRVSPRWLLVSAAVLAIVGPILNAFLRQALGVIGEGGGLSWPQWGEPAVALRAIFVTGTYPVVTWIVYVLVGMAVATLLIAARRNGTEKRFVAWTAGIGAFLAVFAVSTSALVYEFFGRAVLVATLPPEAAAATESIIGTPGFGAPLSPQWWALVLQTPHTGTTLDILRGVGVALFVIAGMLFLAGVLPTSALRVLEPVRAAGAAPLTVYTVHVLAAAATSFVLLSGAVDASTELPWWYLGPSILGIHILGAVAIGAILAALRRRGPLEAFVSSVSGAVARRLGGVPSDGRRRRG